MPALHEQYRPTVWADVVGQDAAIRQLDRVGRKGYGGRAYWFAGPSGTGKTTLARIIAGSVADPLAIEESNGADLGVDDCRRMERDFQHPALPWRDGGLTGRAWILNEAHLIRGAVLSRLLTTLEPEAGIPSGVVVAFTTTVKGQKRLFAGCEDAGPLVSRCTVIELADTPASRLAFAQRAKLVAGLVGADGLPDWAYTTVVDAEQGSLRAVLQTVESGELWGRCAEILGERLVGLPLDGKHNRERAELQGKLAELGPI